ncbi:hypothetical protein [Nocardia cyriacigeorgica]|uniref:hypothetical protein n=1 Tax=Nocardia cyriacigeorgica TaxID=135487 RepID=UPI0024556CAA|nr:hypothetical protein [Nocardia cyriacigeorgica]
MRWTRAVVPASILSIMIAGCGAGPSDRPGVAIERPPVAGEATTSAAGAAPPPGAEGENPKMVGGVAPAPGAAVGD